MASNKDKALRTKEIADKKLAENDLIGAKKFALEAQTLFPALEGLVQLIATLDVCIASQSKVDGEKDWHAILCVKSGADEDTVRKQYRKLALLLHPDKNKSAAAEDAFKLISEARSVLSGESRRTLHDHKRSTESSSQEAARPNQKRAASGDATGSSNFSRRSKEPPASATFWTSCHRCRMQYNYLWVYLNHTLFCRNCHASFLATAINPTSEFVYSQLNSPSEFVYTQLNLPGEFVFSKLNPASEFGYSELNPPREFVFSQHTTQQSQPNFYCFQYWESFTRTAGAASANFVEKAKWHKKQINPSSEFVFSEHTSQQSQLNVYGFQWGPFPSTARAAVQMWQRRRRGGTSSSWKGRMMF